MKEKTEKTANKMYYIPARNKVGAVLRTNDAIERIDVLKEAVDRLLNIDKIDLVSIMIYSPEDIDGGLRGELIKLYGKERKRVEITKVSEGNFYDDLLNLAISEQTRRGVDYSLIISAEAYLYINEENINKMLGVAKEGALMIGLDIDEYREVIEQGYISNVFCMYRNVVTQFTDIWKLESVITDKTIKKDHFGMEEIYVLRNIINNYGYDRVAIVKPLSGKLIESEDNNSREWRNNVIKTKKKRFEKMCKILKIDKDRVKKEILKIN